MDQIEENRLGNVFYGPAIAPSIDTTGVQPRRISRIPVLKRTVAAAESVSVADDKIKANPADKEEATVAVINVPAAKPPVTKTETPVDATPVASPVPSKPTGFKKDCEEVEVRQHRRVHKKQRGGVVAALVAEIKAKLGMPNQTAANDLVIRSLAYMRCRELKIRPKHSQAIVSQVIVLVYCPDHTDIDAAIIRNSKEYTLRMAALDYENRSRIYRLLVPKSVHAFFYTGPSQRAGSG